jgi:hypothetical protein
VSDGRAAGRFVRSGSRGPAAHATPSAGAAAGAPDMTLTEAGRPPHRGGSAGRPSRRERRLAGRGGAGRGSSPWRWRWGVADERSRAWRGRRRRGVEWEIARAGRRGRRPPGSTAQWPASPRFLPGRRRPRPSHGARRGRWQPALPTGEHPCCVDPVDPALRPGHGAQRRYRKGDTIGAGLPRVSSPESPAASNSRFCPILSATGIRGGRASLVNPNPDMPPVFLPDLLPEPVAFGRGFAL